MDTRWARAARGVMRVAYRPIGAGTPYGAITGGFGVPGMPFRVILRLVPVDRRLFLRTSLGAVRG